MSSIGELDARVTALEATVNSIQLGTIPVSSLSAAQRKEWENVIYPVINGYRAKKGASNNDYANWQAGDEIMHIDNVGKTQILGMVITIPFNPTTDLNDRAKFDMYQENSPAL